MSQQQLLRPARTAALPVPVFQEEQEAKQKAKAGPIIKAMAGSVGGIVEAHCLQPMVRAYRDATRGRSPRGLRPFSFGLTK